MTSRRARARWAPFLLLIALGCASGATPEGMRLGPLPAPVSAAPAGDTPTLTIAVRGGRATNPLGTSKISNRAFLEALVVEIARTGRFRPVFDRVADFHLDVAIVSFEQPFWGWLDMEVALAADWTLTRQETGETVWARRVSSRFTATEQDSQWG
ncbi:MAG: hypothetical protein HKP30_01050, partial [Myxococcales bacterium]|nr:hypothetical protein [Myxococcales bacterium]